MARPRKTSDHISADKIILPIATRLFAERGYAGTSLRDIIKEAGLAMGTPYHHFGNKRGLYLACLRSLFEDLSGRQYNILRNEPDPAIALRRFFLAACEANMDPLVSRLVSRELADNVDVTMQVLPMEGLADEYDALLKVIGQLEGEETAYAKAYLCHSLVYGLGRLNAYLQRAIPPDRRPTIADPRAMARHVFEALFPGLGAFETASR